MLRPTAAMLMSTGFLVAWLPPDVCGYHLVLARGWHAQSICLQSTCTLSDTVAGLGFRLAFVCPGRLLSGTVVVRCSGQAFPCSGVEA